MNTPRIIGQIVGITGSVANRRPASDHWKTIVTLAQASHSNLLRTLRHDVWVLSAIILLGTVAAHAQDAAWLPAPLTGDWNTGTNWTPNIVPTGTATFDVSNKTTVTFSSPNTSVSTLLFNTAAPAYTFNLSGSSRFNITAGGIVNNSSNGQIFTVSSVALPLAVLSINGIAGNATIINNNLGETDFVGLGSAGTANITTNSGGITTFQQQSTGGTANITTNNGGLTVFEENPSGGGDQARLITAAGGIVDISDLMPSGMTAGSIEGAGIYRLGSKALTVGGNNFNTEVSGTIVDGGFGGGTGGSLIKVGTGTLTLSGADTYTGGTTINGGTLQIGNGGTNGSIVGDVTDNANLAFNRSDVVTFSGIVSGTGTLSQIGPGTLTLSGLNLYSGGTNLNGGVLAVQSDTNLGTGPLNFDGGTLQALAAGGGITSNKAIVLNALGGTFLADANTTSTLSGGITGVGAFTKDGAGIVVLAGASAYSGVTTISAGTLQAGSTAAFSPNSAFTVNSILDLHGFSNTVGSLAGTGTVTNNGGPRNFDRGR